MPKIRYRGTALACVVIAGAASCTAPKREGVSPPQREAGARAADDRPSSRSADLAEGTRPRATDLVALVDGETVGFDDLRAALVEASGHQALRDRMVDLRLARRLAEANLEIGPAEIEAERALLLRTLSEDPSRAVELLAAIRLRQGLGDIRLEALLRRNAGLRALVAREATVDEEGVMIAYDMLHGPKRVARMAVLGSLADAERFAGDLADGKTFTELAVERSLDEGAARGGLLPAIARRDPSYPEPLRAAIFTTPTGAVSPPILDGPRFYIVQVLREIPADGTPLETARTQCEDALRLARERILMDALARELASLGGATIFDRSFDPPAR